MGVLKVWLLERDAAAEAADGLPPRWRTTLREDLTHHRTRIDQLVLHNGYIWTGKRSLANARSFCSINLFYSFCRRNCEDSSLLIRGARQRKETAHQANPTPNRSESIAPIIYTFAGRNISVHSFRRYHQIVGYLRSGQGRTEERDRRSLARRDASQGMVCFSRSVHLERKSRRNH